MKDVRRLAMNMHSRYPELIIDLNKLRQNVARVVQKCSDCGVEVAGVIKGCTGLPECAAQFERAGVRFMASSRLEQLEPLRAFDMQTPLMLIRIPMLSEAADVVRITDISLNSEVEVLRELDRQAGIQDRIHQVLLMVDLGDLREGFWDKDELLDAALMVENDLHNLHLAGVGTNLGCYGSVAATPEKLQELIDCAEMIEEKIGRELEFISGGATSTLPRIMDGDLPARINMLRVGEGILLAKDLEDLWGYDMSFMNRDVFTLRAEVIEVKDKPSYPVGEIMFDSFGNKPEYEDRGTRKRALIALGKVDYAFPEKLDLKEPGIEVLGASSDHTILDIEDAEREIKVGDIVEFLPSYANLVYLTNSPNIEKVYI